MQLIELAALAVHEIAVQLFQMEPAFHLEDEIAPWKPPNGHLSADIEEQWPTLFRHTWYLNYQQYPHGLADVAGFWAESRIFGGVVLFDRRNPSLIPESERDSIWFHPSREDVTYRIFQLLEDQKQALLRFLTSESPDLSTLPILGDERNITREDPEEPIQETQIYRNIWERNTVVQGAANYRLRDV
jgi:hypothetical protein